LKKLQRLAGHRIKLVILKLIKHKKDALIKKQSVFFYN